MHELALTEKMLKLVLSEAESHQAVKIIKIKIKIGELSGIIEDCVEYYFQLAARDTLAAGAELEFIRCKAVLFCPKCRREFEKKPPDFNCPDCGNLCRLTDSGRECFVESIEVE
jgi:hydrogenase nickel incorporation protein HypA/HybF